MTGPWTVKSLFRCTSCTEISMWHLSLPCTGTAIYNILIGLMSTGHGSLRLKQREALLSSKLTYSLRYDTESLLNDDRQSFKAVCLLLNHNSWRLKLYQHCLFFWDLCGLFPAQVLVVNITRFLWNYHQNCSYYHQVLAVVQVLSIRLPNKLQTIYTSNLVLKVDVMKAVKRGAKFYYTITVK